MQLMYSTANFQIALSDIQHLENHADGLAVITVHTRWQTDLGGWGNALWVSKDEALDFARAWYAFKEQEYQDDRTIVQELVDETRQLTWSPESVQQERDDRRKARQAEGGIDVT